ncbi:hypothetical protein BDC45DRAFT_508160 [Circinella umbellata]|nr:hypothetical protein BDC45DRAFT_508160 [Circinella umbellata]
MQIRWFSSLFSTSFSSSFLSCFLSCFLSYFLTTTSNCIHPLLPLLFPSLRSSTFRSITTLAPLSSAIDHLTPLPLTSDPSLATCLSLPLSFVIQISDSTNFTPKQHLSKVLVSDAYIFDPQINHLRRRTRMELNTG